MFFTHLFTPEILAAFEKLRRESSAFGDLFILCEDPARIPHRFRKLVQAFDILELASRYPQIPHQTVIPGNAHLAFCRFMVAHPAYDHIWFIEYDVRFSGSWSSFFAHHRSNPSDLLASHLRTYEEEPDWYWWATLSTGTDELPPQARLASFDPIFRISRRGLELIAQRLQEGWGGHYEALLPTVLALGGLRVEDFGGDGRFTRAENRNAWYACQSSQEGRFDKAGTHRYRPPHTSWGEQSDMIYHPVKRERRSFMLRIRFLLCWAIPWSRPVQPRNFPYNQHQ